jgi:TPR repeat protein
MNSRPMIASLLALTIGAAAWAQKSLSIGEARRAYYLGEYSRSLALYEELAAGRDAEAAECAGFMLLLADGAYGGQVRRDVSRALSLLTQAAQAGRPGAGFMLNMLDLSD